MTKTLQPHSLKLVIEWFELEDDAYPDVGLPLGVSIFVELQVEPNSMFTVVKNVDGVINLESSWYKGVTKIADKAPKNSIEDVGDQPSSLKTEEEVDYLESQGDLYSANDLDTSGAKSELESVASSRSSITVQSSTLKPKSSKIPVRRSGLDGTFDDLDLDLDLDIPPSPTLSSQDSLPWHSIKDIDGFMDENSQTGIDIDDLFTDLEDIYHPILRYENGDINLHAAREVEPGFYKVEIAFYRHFTKEDQGWYGVDLCDVIETCPPIPGKMVFKLQDHPSLATQIVGPKPEDLHEMDDGSLETPFDPREKSYLAFWAWTHTTYLEFWGEREVDENYYDDLIADNAYLDSDELVDYVEFMFKTRDDGEEDVVPETIQTPEKAPKSKHYMSPISEENEEEKCEDGQVDDTVQEDVTALNVDDVVSGSECSTPIPEKEECESEEDEDVVLENAPIPNADNVGLEFEEGLVTSSVEEEVEDMVPDVSTPDPENAASDPGERSTMPIIEETTENMKPENITAPNIGNAVHESEEDEARFGGPLDPLPEPVLDYAESLKWCQKQLAMSAAQAAFRRQAVFCLHRMLPALFVVILTICTCMNGPPVTVSTPTRTLHTVKYYANHLGGMSYNALKNVNVSFPDFGFHETEWFPYETTYTPTAASLNEKAAEDFSDVQEYFLWKLIHETLEEAGFTDCPLASEFAEPTTESAISPSSLDAEMSPPPEITAEATTTPDPSADVTVTLAPNAEITSTLDHATPPPASTETAAHSFAIEQDTSLHLCPSRHRNPNDPYPHNGPHPPPPPPPAPLSDILAGFAKGVLRHIACSTSPICTISRISDKYDPPWGVFYRFDCDGQGGLEDVYETG
ncbi:hypothetical protein TMatcc_000250 [Talaromyces marneffei ATCC 18224]|uniref:uncharacterized protein n=1 Tax=Talaromyces marneffei TaxID=37727 RepID=UPI0012A91267|nr:uncharacterized protein EYB26_005342 [Talaromyces marneffei]QGA17667.1 hypothetical protein EYB26_005342 [Talaromyces marneffei]